MNKSPYYPSQDPVLKMRQEMKLRNFSPKIIKSYSYYITNILQFANKGASGVTSQDIRDYLETLVNINSSASTVNCAYSALKFYFEKILRRKFFINLPRAKKEKKLPVVLSKEEVKKIIDAVNNPKHKCILQLLYGCGLRISEVIKIKMEDVDCGRKMLYVKKGKGNKDRCTILPEKLVKVMEQQKTLKNPKDYLFTGYDRKSPLSTMSVNKIVKQAAAKAEIGKNVSAHSLRHSFATHLLENGVSIRYIQELLGHARLETTQIYTKVSNANFKNITNPLDNLNL